MWKKLRHDKRARNVMTTIAVVVSALLQTYVIQAFIKPAGLLSGGFTGIAILVDRVTSLYGFNISTSLGMIALNIPVAWACSKNISKRFTFFSLMQVFLTSAFLRIFNFSPIFDDRILNVIYGGVLYGFGIVLALRGNASSGGTDIIAMILKRYTSLNIGTVLLLVDVTGVIMAYFVFGPETGLFSSLGLLAKSLVIGDVIENINLCKCFSIICDDPGPICDYIIHGLNRSATVYEAQGAFSHHKKTVILTTMKRSQALKLKNYIRSVEPTAFILISNSSEIIGKGFLAN